MASAYEIGRRRSGFFNHSFDEMVELIIDLEEKVEELEEDVAGLEITISKLEAEQ